MSFQDLLPHSEADGAEQRNNPHHQTTWCWCCNKKKSGRRRTESGRRRKLDGRQAHQYIMQLRAARAATSVVCRDGMWRLFVHSTELTFPHMQQVHAGTGGLDYKTAVPALRPSASIPSFKLDRPDDSSPPFPHSLRLRLSRRRRSAMGCGGSKEDVATGNTTGSKLFLRKKSSVSTSHAATTSTDTSAGVAVKDVVKANADNGEAASTAAKDVAIEEKKEDDAAKKAARAVDAKVTEASPAPDEGDQAEKQAEEEEQLPESTMADEPKEAAHNVEEKVKESETIDTEKEKAMSPAPANEDGESAGQQKTTAPVRVEAKPAVGEKKAEEVADSETSGKKNSADDEQAAATTTPSESAVN